MRSLISLFLLANLAAAPALIVSPQPEAASESAVFSDADLLQVSPIPHKKPLAIAPVIKAKAAFLMDMNTGLTLFEQNPDEPLPMASLTKIMTAMVILDAHDLDEVVTVKNNFSDVEGVKVWLRKGERITVGELLKALLVPSAGDAALALAEFHSGSVDAFVNAMNDKAALLRLYNTHFQNPIGLDGEGHYSSARDLAVMAKYAMRNRDFRRIVGQTEASVVSEDGTVRTVHSTDELLNSYLDIRGVKTGTTDGAGESLINVAHGPQGQEVVAVLLNSPQRFQENKRMIDWSLRNYLW